MEVSPSWPDHLSPSQVNDGLILYDQNQPESVGWSATDSFSFTVSSPPAFLPPHTFTILISYQANEHLGHPQHRTRLLNNAGTESLSAVLNHTILREKFKKEEFSVCVCKAPWWPKEAEWPLTAPSLMPLTCWETFQSRTEKTTTSCIEWFLCPDTEHWPYRDTISPGEILQKL